MPKVFTKPAADIQPLAVGFGGCFASDRITVDGRPVGFMYRDERDGRNDSGWRFLAGDESQDYVDDPNNFGIYDVNTIANYDPAIVPYLEAPTFSAFQRMLGSDEFEPAPFPG